MAFDGNGVFSRIHSWVTDASNSVNISSTRMDADTDDIADGLSACITRAGNSTIQADLPMDGFNHTDVDDADARDQYASAAQVQDSGLTYAATVGGTANAITLTLSPAITAYAEGQAFTFVAGSTNTAAATVAVSGQAATAIKKGGGLALGPGDIAAGAAVTVVHDGTDFELVAAAHGGGNPTGSVTAYAGATIPGGWLLCNGQAVSRTTYVGLWTALGDLYGNGNGSTTFNVPDLMGRVIAGEEASQTRLTTSGSGINGATLGAAGGNEDMDGHTHTGPSHTHTTGNQSASHTHVAPLHGHTFEVTSDGNANAGYTGGFTTASGGTTTTKAAYTGGASTVDGRQIGGGGNSATGTQSASHNHTVNAGGTGATGSTGAGSSGNVQPTMVMQWIIKA